MPSRQKNESVFSQATSFIQSRFSYAKASVREFNHDVILGIMLSLGIVEMVGGMVQLGLKAQYDDTPQSLNHLIGNSGAFMLNLILVGGTMANYALLLSSNKKAKMHKAIKNLQILHGIGFVTFVLEGSTRSTLAIANEFASNHPELGANPSDPVTYALSFSVCAVSNALVALGDTKELRQSANKTKKALKL